MKFRDDNEMAEFALATEDMLGVYPFFDKLPRVSSLWNASSENSNSSSTLTYWVEFEHGRLVVVMDDEGDTHIKIQDKED